MSKAAGEALDELLERVAWTLAGATPGHRATFAALLAERAAAQLRDEDERVIPMFDTLWRVAEDGAPDPRAVRDAEMHIATLATVAALVDVDRVNAFATFRAINVLEEAVRCALGVAGGGPIALAFAFLASACDVAAGAPTARAQVLERWHWERVGDAARYLNEALVTRSSGPARHRPGG